MNYLPQTDEEALEGFIRVLEQFVERHPDRFDVALPPGLIPPDEPEEAVPSDPLTRCPLCGAMTRVPTFCAACTDYVPAGPITSELNEIQRQIVAPFVQELAAMG